MCPYHVGERPEEQERVPQVSYGGCPISFRDSSEYPGGYFEVIGVASSCGHAKTLQQGLELFPLQQT